MLDQAETLRRRMKQSAAPREAKVLSVISGKGGVGNSNVSLNIALALQKLGKKVILFDLDIGMGNLDVLMGFSATRTVVDMIEHRLPIEEMVEEGPDGLNFIPGGTSLRSLFELDASGLAHFLTQLESLQTHFDFVLFDIGAGISTDAMKFSLSSDEILLVTTPEPTAITDAYAAVKFIHLREKNTPLYLLVNRSETDKEGRETVARFQAASEKFLRKKIELFGILPEDRSLLQAVKAEKPVLNMAPGSRFSRALTAAVESYAGVPKKPQHTYQSFIKKLLSYFSTARRN